MIRHILLTALLCLASSAWADERILDYRSDIEVHEDGWLTVTETIRVRAEGNQVRRGIYRDFRPGIVTAWVTASRWSSNPCPCCETEPANPGIQRR